MPNELLRPTVAVRVKLPPGLSYSKYDDSRLVSKSSHQIHAACGVEHSLVGPPPAGAATVTGDGPVLVPLVAGMGTPPTATALTRPVADTVAKPVLLLLQVMTRPVSTLLPAS